MAEAQLPISIQADGEVLTVTLGTNFGKMLWKDAWSNHLPALPSGPFKRLVIDLQVVQNPDSTFFSGALTLLERLRNPHLTSITLLHAAPAVAETIQIMNLGRLFRIQRDASGARPAVR